MLLFHWGLFGVALFSVVASGASIKSADYDVEQIYEAQRSKRSYKRGQTQSQYLNFGQPELNGKAEAEATESGSRSTVAGTHGMGQAQSQFSSGDCSGCGVDSPVYEYSTGSPDPLTLGGNIISDTDRKPSSTIGLDGTSPSRVFRPDNSFSAGSVDQASRSVVGGALTPGQGILTGQLEQPGISEGVSAPTGPGASSSFTPNVRGAGRLESPNSDGSYTLSGTYTPGTSSTGQFLKPGTLGSYVPNSIYTPGTPGQLGSPSIRGSYIPASGYTSGVSGTGKIGKPGTDGTFSPNSGYIPSAGIEVQVGRSDIFAPGIPERVSTADSYTPGRGYITGTSSVGETGRPNISSALAPGSGYAAGQVGQSSTTGGYIPASGYAPAVSEGQVGRPRTGDIYSTGSGYAPSSDITGQPGRPGAGDIYAPGIIYTPKIHSTGKIDTPGAGRSFAPGNGYAPGTSNIGQTGIYTPHNVEQVGTRGTSFSYGPAAGSGDVGQHKASDFVKPGIGGTGEEGHGQDRTPHLIAPPMIRPGTIQGPQTGIGFSSQVPAYGHPGQQIPAFTSGTSYFVPGGGKEQVLQYPPGSKQIPTYRINGQSPTAYGQPGQISDKKILQPGPSIGYSSRTGEPIQGYPQKPKYGPGYIHPTASVANSLTGGPSLSGIHYPAPGIQQILKQPGQGTILRPGTSGVQQGVDRSAPQLGSGFQPSYQARPSGGYGQLGYGTQEAQGAGFQSGGTLSQPVAGGQQIQFTPNSGLIQSGILQSGYSQPRGVQQSIGAPSAGLQPPGRQPSLGSVYPSSNIQPGTVYERPSGSSFEQSGITLQQSADMVHGQKHVFIQPGASFDQRETGFQPNSHSLVFEGAGSGTALDKAPFGIYQIAGFDQPETGRSYSKDTTYGGIQQPGQSGRQTGFPSGNTFSQYPGSEFSQRGIGEAPLPGTNVQHGTETHQSSSGQLGYGQFGPAQYDNPGRGQQIDTGVRQISSVTPQYGQSPQTIVQPGAVYIPGSTSGLQQQAAEGQASGVGDDAFAQAESSISNGQAAASAQGKKNGGTAKTQVQGTYSSNGSFSASAMTSDNDRSVSSQVTGGVEGAMSQSQGQGGAAQSQAQVQVNEKTGGTKASSQSGGIIHQSQSEVQANDKGGLADAQSSGPGQTSSQAQIGFRPGQDGEIVRSAGGGQASAQSGSHSGNSQSQIQGTTRYGVSYHGAAQSASGTKEQVATYRDQNRDLFNTISHFGGPDAVTDRVDTVFTPALTSESDIPDLQLKASRTSKEATSFNKLDKDSILTEAEDEEEPYDEYEDEEDYYNENHIKMEANTGENKQLETSTIYRTHTQKSPSQIQQGAVTDRSKKYNVVQNQNDRIQKYSTRTTTEAVPNGFRGTVNVEKKFHTKSLEPHKIENMLNITTDEESEPKPRTPDSFVTVTKSITGSMDNSKNPPTDNKNFQSTYYTKSSTCGYFTFSCNIVYGANGRSKICRPKAPTSGKC